MTRKSLTLIAVLAAVLTGARPAVAQDNDALIKLLIKKGVLTQEEVDALRKEAAAPPPVAVSAPTPAPAGVPTKPAAAETKKWVSTSGSKYLEKLTLSGRLQAQFAGLGTDIDSTDVDPAATNHFFLRRIYWGFKADLNDNWSSTFNYDFAGSTFDAAFLTWKQSPELAIDVGLRKVPFVWDEFYTSGDIRAIERSPVTRYFVESNNGRRLGAGSYRVGVFAGGAQNGVFYSAAVTDPERDETFSGVTSAGNRTTNSLAYWGNLGYTGTLADGAYRLGASIGFLPDQGGKTLGAGDDLTVYGLYGELQTGGLFLRGEYLWSQNDHGASATRDARSSGFYLMPCYRFGNLEAVLRYSYLDSDGRSVDLGDGIRSAPSGGTMNKLSEWFVGGNWYVHGNDTKIQLGYIHGKSKDSLTGAAARATTDGVRSQMQLQF